MTPEGVAKELFYTPAYSIKTFNDIDYWNENKLPTNSRIFNLPMTSHLYSELSERDRQDFSEKVRIEYKKLKQKHRNKEARRIVELRHLFNGNQQL